MIDNTFWMDFTIADAFGLAAIQDTYNRAFKEWRVDCDYLAALVITLNHKIWQHWEKGNMRYAELYDRLWKEAHSWAMDNLKGEELSRYYWTVD